MRLYREREIRADRDAIRTLLDGPHRPIKLEIINFANDQLLPDMEQDLFPISCVNQEGCLATKLTANADRYRNHIKDILDLCMMRNKWGPIPQAAWNIACDEYGERVIATALGEALQALSYHHQSSLEHAVESLHMSEDTARSLYRTPGTRMVAGAHQSRDNQPVASPPTPAVVQDDDAASHSRAR